MASLNRGKVLDAVHNHIRGRIDAAVGDGQGLIIWMHVFPLIRPSIDGFVTRALREVLHG